MKHHAVHSQILLQKLFENKLCLSADAKSEMSENITSVNIEVHTSITFYNTLLYRTDPSF